MLNELRLLARALVAGRQTIVETHPRFQLMPKGIYFVLGIGTDGGVVWCEERVNDPTKGHWLRRIEHPSAGISFPGFNWKNKRQVEKCLKEFPKQIQPYLAGHEQNLPAFVELVKRCAESTLDLDGFLSGFQTAAASAELSPKAKKLLDDLEKKPEDAKVRVYLEVADRDRYDSPVVSEQTMESVNRFLLAVRPEFAAGGIGAEIRTARSAYGAEGEIQTAFPQPTLPVLGKVTLFSMSSESGCQSRYGKFKSDAFPVTKTDAEAMKNALETITGQERQGKTWTAVPAPAGKKRDLLISYLDGQPETDALFAAFFGAAAASEEKFAEERFDRACESVIRALKGIRARPVDRSVRVLVLSKADPGRTKVAVSETYRPDEIQTAAQNWKEGAQNIPLFETLIPTGKGKPAACLRPLTPFPSEMMEALNAEWRRQATEKTVAPGCSLAEIHRVMFRQDLAATSRLLNLAGRRFPALLVPAMAAAHSHGDSPVEARKAALIAIPILGILLWKLGRKKEEYMESPPYAIGRLFALVDQLHALYGEEVRKGMPNQLLGNSLMATALERPATALALCAQRILPYQAWARVAKGGKAGLAHRFLKEMGQLTTIIHERGIPERISETDRAEMLLGYLARTEKTEREVKV